MTSPTTSAIEIPAGHLFALMMCSDPWPVNDTGFGTGQAELTKYADEVARSMGFTDWLDAYHSTNQSFRHVPAALSQPATYQSATDSDGIGSKPVGAGEGPANPVPAPWIEAGGLMARISNTKYGRGISFNCDEACKVFADFYRDLAPTPPAAEDGRDAKRLGEEHG